MFADAPRHLSWPHRLCSGLMRDLRKHLQPTKVILNQPTTGAPRRHCWWTITTENHITVVIIISGIIIISLSISLLSLITHRFCSHYYHYCVYSHGRIIMIVIVIGPLPISSHKWLVSTLRIWVAHCCDCESSRLVLSVLNWGTSLPPYEETVTLLTTWWMLIADSSEEMDLRDCIIVYH